MRLYVIRHGESETNFKKCWTGWLDVELTDNGRADAKKAGTILNNVVFDKIYSSDLIRAVQTAQTAIPACKPQTTPLLREINVGTLAGKPLGSISDEQRKRFSKVGYAELDGESKLEFEQRIYNFLKELEVLDCQNVAAFSHAGWLRVMLDTIVGTSLPREKICCNNCTVAIFEYTKKVWRLHSWINLS